MSKLQKLTVYVGKDATVFVSWLDKGTSGTITFTAEEAIEIGRFGTMAKVRKENSD